jgi:hypothetical protein
MNSRPNRDDERGRQGGEISRRAFLRTAGAVAGAGAGFVVVAASASRDVQLETGHDVQFKGGTQRFASRPDLQPPEVFLRVRKAGSVDGVIVTECHSGPGQQGPMLLDRNGQLVWFKPLSQSPHPSPRAFNVKIQRYRGQPVLSFFQGAMVSAHGEGHYELYDQTYRPVAQVYAGNGYNGDLHEFVLTPQGTALFTCYGRATGNLPVGGHTRRGDYFYGVVQEVDVATGKLLFQWRSDEHVSLSASYMRLPANPSNAWDYFHINSIGIDPADGHLIISSRNTWACYKVHRRTGRVLWTLGGKHSDFQMNPGTHFAFQHDVVPHPGGVLTIFDNEGGPPREARQSRALVLRLDERGRRIRSYRAFTHHPPISAGALGSVQPLARGHLFVGWGNPSYFTEYDARGRVVFDARLAPGTASYRAFKEPWTGRPAQPPDVSVVRSGQSAKVYVSWNGDTEVVRWRVLGGSAPNAMSEIGVAPRAGFETMITLNKAPAWIAVQGLGSSGHTLGTSKPKS